MAKAVTTYDRQRIAITKKIAADFPEAYYVAGVGYCGPQWEQAQAAWDAFRQQSGLV